MSLTHRLVRQLPRAALSRAVGKMSRLRLPPSLLKLYALAARIDLQQAEHPLAHYKSVESLFCRRLKPGLRPVQGEFCSPCDGQLTASQPVEQRSLLQVKGITYSADQLVFGQSVASAGPAGWQPAWSLTCYLSPSDYHRVHAPVSGEIISIRYIPGDLWPVNTTFASLVPNLYVTNERLSMRIAAQEGVVDVVMVGAMNVGRISCPFIKGFVSNASRRRAPWAASTRYQIKVGDEIGAFSLGSTVVLIVDRGMAIARAFIQQQQRLQVGQSLLQ